MVCSEQVAFAAGDARPHGIGLCFLIGSALALGHWLESGRARYLVGYSVLSALCIHLHYMMAPALLVHGIHGMVRTLKAGKRNTISLGVAWLCTGLMLLPLGPQVCRLVSTREQLSFVPTPFFFEFLAALIPPVLLAPIAFVLLVLWLCGHEPFTRTHSSADGVRMAAIWAVLPVLACFIVSKYTETKIFVPRYFLGASPGLALLGGWAIRYWTAPVARRFGAVAVVICAILAFGGFPHGGEDWIGALRTVRSIAGNSDTPILMPSGFIEASDLRAISDPVLSPLLFAPVGAYPLMTNRIVRLPYRFDDRSVPHLEQVISTVLTDRDRFLLVCRWEGVSFKPWLEGRLASRGFRSRSLGNFGNVSVYLFEVQSKS